VAINYIEGKKTYADKARKFFDDLRNKEIKDDDVFKVCSEVSGQLDSEMRSINVAFEAYPELKAHRSLADAMQQNSYLQKEITAAREVYNDTVLKWNQDIFAWPTKMIAAAK
jgi:hypothetical protein